MVVDRIGAWSGRDDDDAVDMADDKAGCRCGAEDLGR